MATFVQSAMGAAQSAQSFFSAAGVQQAFSVGMTAAQAGLSMFSGVSDARTAQNNFAFQSYEIELDRSARKAEASQLALDNVRRFREQMATNEAIFATGGGTLGQGTSKAFAESSFEEMNRQLKLNKLEQKNIDASSDLALLTAKQAARARSQASLIQGVGGAISAFANRPITPADTKKPKTKA